MATLSLKNVNKIYPNGFQAVYDFNLDIKDKDFIVLVGPSGCGKSTTLRMIAGLEDITKGEIYIDDVLINNVAPKNRSIAMVFQSYALYPHMTVFDNMAYGLKMRNMPIEMINEKVDIAANSLGISELLERKPAELSGGQRQRVALGRAIVRDSKVFLMDEPLSNLDAKLRVQTRGELIKLHHKLGNTTIYVTHDQIEAMTMATKIVVMKDGYIEQVGKPETVYNYPNNQFVGAFIGTPPMNFIKVKVNDKGKFLIDDCNVTVSDNKLEIIKENDLYNKEVILGIRPEDIHVENIRGIDNKDLCIETKVIFSEILGSDTNVFFNLNNIEVISKVEDTKYYKIGQDIKIYFDTSKIHFFDFETKVRLTSLREEREKEELINLLNK